MSRQLTFSFSVVSSGVPGSFPILGKPSRDSREHGLCGGRRGGRVHAELEGRRKSPPVGAWLTSGYAAL
jgi:hypothetical protein